MPKLYLNVLRVLLSLLGKVGSADGQAWINSGEAVVGGTVCVVGRGVWGETAVHVDLHIPRENGVESLASLTLQKKQTAFPDTSYLNNATHFSQMVGIELVEERTENNKNCNIIDRVRIYTKLNYCK